MPLCCNCARYTSKDVGGELAEVVEGIATVVGGRMIGGRVVGGGGDILLKRRREGGQFGQLTSLAF